MEISNLMNSADLGKVRMQTEALNKSLGNKGVGNNELGKDDFLKILITQLSHQDPTKPVEDREFIAQMAQFSSLEQMTNMAKEFSKLQEAVDASRAVGLIGRYVEIGEGENSVSGVVEEISGKDFPQVLVNGRYYDYHDVRKVR